MQRSNSPARAGLLFIVITLAVVSLICCGFLAFGVTIPEWFVIVGRWIPAIVALIVLRASRLEGGLVTWFGLRAGGWRRMLGGSALTVIVLLAAYAASAGVVVALGLAQLQPWSVLGQAALLVVPMILVFSLSTIGEEVAWRGFLQHAFGGWGFWWASSVIAAAWVVFHIPLHGAMAIQGTLPVNVAITSTLGLFFLGLLLSAAAVRFRSVWPAVFAHALPMSTLNLFADASTLPVSTQWVVAGISAAAVLVAAALLAPRGSQRSLPR